MNEPAKKKLSKEEELKRLKSLQLERKKCSCLGCCSDFFVFIFGLGFVVTIACCGQMANRMTPDWIKYNVDEAQTLSDYVWTSFVAHILVILSVLLIGLNANLWNNIRIFIGLEFVMVVCWLISTIATAGATSRTHIDKCVVLEEQMYAAVQQMPERIQNNFKLAMQDRASLNWELSLECPSLWNEGAPIGHAAATCAHESILFIKKYFESVCRELNLPLTIGLVIEVVGFLFWWPIHIILYIKRHKRYVRVMNGEELLQPEAPKETKVAPLPQNKQKIVYIQYVQRVEASPWLAQQPQEAHQQVVYA